MNEIRADMLKAKRMVSDVEMIIGKREGETELVNKLIDAQNLLTFCMSRLENAIILPCKVGDTVYGIAERYTECTPYGERYSEYACAGCEKECDSIKEHYIRPVKITNIHWIFNMWDYYGKTWFTDPEAAQKALKAR